MKRAGGAFILLSFLFITASSRQKFQISQPSVPMSIDTGAKGAAKYVLLVSADGLSYPMISKMMRSDRYPVLKHLIKQGSFRKVMTVFPSMTWVAHTTMVTGQYPRSHGIIANKWIERYKEYIRPVSADITEPDRKKRTYTLYDLASRSGLKTAAINWPGTQKADTLTYNLPELLLGRYQSNRYVSKPLIDLYNDYIKGSGEQAAPILYANAENAKNLLKIIANSEGVELDLLVRDLVIQLIHQPEKKRPRLILAHFLASDHWKHLYGSSDRIESWALELLDSHIKHLVRALKGAGIYHETAILITSDHGFVNVTRRVNLEALFSGRGLIKIHKRIQTTLKKEKLAVINQGSTAYIYLKPGVSQSFRKKALQSVNLGKYSSCIEEIYEPARYRELGLPVKTVKPSLRLRSGFHDGAPDFIVLAKPHCYFSSARGKVIQKLRVSLDNYQGFHGYLPTHPYMKTFLIAHGAGIRRSSSPLPEVSLVDLAPTVAHLAGIDWPERWPGNNSQFLLDGRVMYDLLENR